MYDNFERCSIKMMNISTKVHVDMTVHYGVMTLLFAEKLPDLVTLEIRSLVRVASPAVHRN